MRQFTAHYRQRSRIKALIKPLASVPILIGKSSNFTRRTSPKRSTAPAAAEIAAIGSRQRGRHAASKIRPPSTGTRFHARLPRAVRRRLSPAPAAPNTASTSEIIVVRRPESYLADLCLRASFTCARRSSFLIASGTSRQGVHPVGGAHVKLDDCALSLSSTILPLFLSLVLAFCISLYSFFLLY